MAVIPVNLPDELVKQIKKANEPEDEFSKFNLSGWIREAVIDKFKDQSVEITPTKKKEKKK